MKIGILTFHRALNVGAVLQAFALQTALCRLGHDAAIVDYGRIGLPPRFKIKRWTFRFIVGAVVAWARTLFLEGSRRRKYKRFVKRYLNLIHCPRRADLHNISCDAFVSGSDLVWNPIYNEGDDTYFLDFAPCDAKKVAYAPSFGTQCDDAQWRVRVVEYLKKFSLVSVRETQSAGFYRLLTGREVEIVCDPTLLLSCREYGRLERKVRNIPKRYIFLYVICNHPYARKYAEMLSDAMRIPVVFYLSGCPIILFCGKQRGTIMNIGPGEFLYLESNADCVVTNSFHGLVFSLIYHKLPHVLLNAEPGDARMVDLLNLVGLPDRVSGNSCVPLPVVDVDWKAVDSKIADLRAASIHFLKRI